MEYLKDLLTPKTFNKISYVAVICWIAYGVILLGIFAGMENSDSFRCEAKLEKMDLVRAKCSNQYNKQYNKSGIPVYGFVIANFFLIGIVCVIYSQVVKSRVDEVKANRQRSDAEGQNRPKSRKLFVAYFCQLAFRFAIAIIFIVLQTQVLYPDSFPSDFHCQLAATGHAANASSKGNTENSTMYDCHNQQATTKTSWMNAVTVGNGVLSLIILIEIVCISVLRVKEGKNFLEDSAFLKYLIKNDLPPQDLLQPERGQQSREVEPQEYVNTQERPQDSEQVPLLPIVPEEQQLQQPSVIDEFIKSQKKSIIESTEADPGLKALFQPKHGEGKRNRDLKLDAMYTNLSLIKDRARYKIIGNRQEQLKVFPMPQEKFQQITRAEIVDADNKKILIVGRPGIGKTLFLTMWIRDWASGNAFNGEFSLPFS